VASLWLQIAKRSELMANTEFDLHVMEEAGDPDLYTVGVWDDQCQIVSLCHIQQSIAFWLSFEKRWNKPGRLKKSHNTKQLGETRQVVSEHQRD